MDHYGISEAMLGELDRYAPPFGPEALTSALAHAVLALCERLDEIPLLAIHDAGEDD